MPAAVPLSADLLLRLHLRLPPRRAGRPGWLDRVALPPPLRLPQHLLLDPRPRRRLLAGRPARAGGAGQPPQRPRHQRGGDDLDDGLGLVRRHRRPHGRRLPARPDRAAPPPSRRRRGRERAGPDDRVRPGRGRRRDGLPARLRLRRDPRRLDARGRRDGRHGLLRGRQPGAERRPQPGRHRLRRPRPAPPPRRREALQRPLLGTRPDPARLGRGLRETARANDRLLAALARDRKLPRPSLARLPAALRPGAEGAHLRADRRADRRAHHLTARDARRGAQLGLPLRLDPRLDLRPLVHAHPRLRLRGHRLHGLHGRHLPGGEGQGPPDHVRDRR